MQVTIWGCRGSLPTPGPHTVHYGGNTSCLEVELANGSILVLDAGTGIRELGAKLERLNVRRIQLLLTHLHLDHVEGLRFFGPLWDEQVRVDSECSPRDPVTGAFADRAGQRRLVIGQIRKRSVAGLDPIAHGRTRMDDRLRPQRRAVEHPLFARDIDEVDACRDVCDLDREERW